jgi:hypothetical protein
MKTFRVKDLMINVLGGRGGGLSYCSEDVSATAPTPITPYILVAAYTPVLHHVRDVTARLAKSDDVEIDGAVASAIDEAALDVGRAVVVAAVQGGGAYYPNPDCGGSSLETIPTPITPVVHKNLAVLKASHLGQLRVQLQGALDATVEAEAALTPRSAADIKQARKSLEGALASLG